MSRAAHPELSGETLPVAPVAALETVSRVYPEAAGPVWAVRDVSLQIDAGSFVCLFGSSGSGKSTLLNLMAGLDLATSGTVSVLGHDLSTASESDRALLRLQRVGVVFQDHLLIEEFTAAENVALPLEAQGVEQRQAHSQALAQLEKVGLSGLGDRLPRELSGGQRQRVGIARALVGGRQLLLADEPTGALDSTNTRSLFTLLRHLCVDEGTTIVLATHESMAREFADVVLEMSDGRLTVAT